MYLVIDLGGTNTRTGLADEMGLLAGTVRKTPNAMFPGLAPLVEAYLEKMQPGPLTGVCAGVAGPVRGGMAQLTNHDWFIDAEALRATTGADEVHLINDLQAQGYALDDVPATSIAPVIEGQEAEPDATRLVLNIGTGCNAAVVHRVRGRLFVPAAESGHTSLPRTHEELDDLYDHLRRSEPHLPIEAAISGRGLTNIHEWLTGRTLTPKAIIDQVAEGYNEARKTLSLFIHILGAAAGNFALHHLPMGGLYLSGSLARAIAPHMDEPAFMSTFIDRGPYTDIVRSIPVSVITEDGFALRGCHRYLRQLLH